jgi:predicted unusual protein kinase regulating ubiquinone biosynthesis (AarF/ABC1/UbiB family)
MAILPLKASNLQTTPYGRVLPDWHPGFAAFPGGHQGHQRSAPGSTQNRTHSLRLRLQKMGPLFSVFGLYLSSRIDLLPLEECQELSRIPDSAEAIPFAETREQIVKELGAPIEELFLAVEPMPQESRLRTSSYPARLRSGEQVSLHVLRPEFSKSLEEQLRSLQFLELSRVFDHWTQSETQRVLADFQLELQIVTNLLVLADTLDCLAHDARNSEISWVPKVYQELCRHRLLVTERSPGTKLSRIASQSPAEGENQFDRRIADLSRPSPDVMARRIYFAWLRQVFFGRRFPMQFNLDDVEVLNDGRMGFIGGCFAAMPEDAHEDIWKYLMAVTVDNPDACCLTLLRQMHPSRYENGLQQLIGDFRQAATLVDSNLQNLSRCNGLVSRIFKQAQLAFRSGYHPRAPLIAFYRGLVSTLRAAENVGPSRDTFLEAVEEAWAAEIFDQITQSARTDVLADMLNKYATAMVELPQKLNEVLSLSVRPVAEPGYAQATRQHTWEVKPSSLSTLLLSAAALLVANNFSWPLSPVWVDRIGLLIWCLLGLAFLRIAVFP